MLLDRPVPWRLWRGALVSGSFLTVVMCTGAVMAAPAGVTIEPPTLLVGDRWLLETDPTHDAVAFNVRVLLDRNQPGATARDIPVRFFTRLAEDGDPLGTEIVGSSETTIIVTVPPVVANQLVDVDLEIVPTRRLSLARTYRVAIDVLHDDDPPSGNFQRDSARAFGPYEFVHFNGDLLFGTTATVMQRLASPPLETAVNRYRLWVAEGMLATGFAYTNQPPATAFVDVLFDDSTGQATVVSGSVQVVPPAPVIDTNGWTGTLGPILLNASGLAATHFTLDLPEGSGWRVDDLSTSTTALLNPVFSSGDVPLPLNENLEPIGPVSGTFAENHEYVDERMAIGLVGRDWSWDVQSLTLFNPTARFLRRHHYDQWLAVKGDLPDANDGYLNQLDTAFANLTVLPGTHGGFTFDATIHPGAFSTHFPHGFVQHSGGLLRFTNSVPAGGSQLTLATATIVAHTGCRNEPNAVPDPATLEAVAVGPVSIGFTAQGGLWLEGLPLPETNPPGQIPRVRRAAAGKDETSGLPLHETADYLAQPVQLYVPGPTVPFQDGLDREDDGNATVDESGEHPGEFNPARWLLTGIRPIEAFALEHPGTDEYLDGEGDYAGVNFRGYPGLTGVSRVGGGMMGPYDLEPCQKVYARSSGTTGRWVADDTTLPPSVMIGGADPFEILFDEWAFQLVGNEPQFEHSVVQGSVLLPHPAEIQLAFDSMEFTCCGNLDKVALADGQSAQQLAYWQQAHIAIQSARFVSADACSMANSCLELHVRARANGLPEDVDGILCFRGSGRMTTGLDGPLPASTLHLPVGSKFAGEYYIEPVRHSFYNDPPGGSLGNNDGFINVAGLANLPFFEVMPSHAHLTGTDLAGGVNPNIIPGWQGGWETNSDTYFSSKSFDTGHRGFPPALGSPSQYLGSTDPIHVPHARRTWFGRIAFDFPVLYDPVTGYFHSLEKKVTDVIIADAEADVPYLNHEKAAIDFGVTVGLSLNNLLSDVLAFATGELTEGFADLAIGPALVDVDQGLKELDGLLSLQVREALGGAVMPALDSGIIASAAAQLKGGAAVNVALGEIHFSAALQNDIATATSGDVTGKLAPIASGLDGMRQFLDANNDTQLGQLMERAMGFLNLPPGLDALSVPELIELGGLDAGPVRERLEILRERMAELRDLVQNVPGLDAELEGLLMGANADYAGLGPLVQSGLQDYFTTVAADPGAYTVEEIEARIRGEIEAGLWAMPVFGQVQTVLRSRFYHLDHLTRQVLASALDQLNRAITDIVAEAIDLDELLGPLKGIGNYVQSASLDGEAVITGNDLTYLSLKGHTVIQTQPIPIEFDPFYEYQQLHADGALGCDPGATSAQFNRITMGATVAPATFTSGEVSITLSSQFSFTDDARLIGFMGGLEVLAEGVSMQPVNFDRMSVLLNIGGNDPSFSDFEFYVAAEAEATLFKSSSPVQLPWTNFELFGGLFAGRTCSDAPYAAWLPPEVTSALPNLPFTGAIAAVDGKFPFYDVGCLMRLKAGANVGAWGAVHHSPGAESPATFGVGAFMGGKVSGDFLCLLSGQGSLFMQSGLGSGGPFLAGTIEGQLELGKCPFCLEIDGHYSTQIDADGNVNVDF